MVDYSKWDHIEVSDDEDETHPNIDTKSLFKWRHEARVQRMDDMDKKKEDLTKRIQDNDSKMKNIKENLKNAKTAKDDSKIKAAQNSLEQLQIEDEKLKDERTFLEKEEKAQPWNVDTLSKPGFTKTIINTSKPKREDMTEEEQLEESKKFMEKYKPDIKKYGMMKEYFDSEEFLMKNSHLTCEDTANYLVIWCIDLQVEEKEALMERVAHQTICMQFLLELARSLKIDPRAAIQGFFQKMRKGDEEYMKGFNDELSAFIGRVKERAQARIDKAMKEYEEEERQKRLGPGGLDPVEVMESLPKELQTCFETKDIQMLQDVFGAMPDEEARYHLKRCVDSGLWVPDANKANADGTAPSPDDEGDETGGEEKFEAVD